MNRRGRPPHPDILTPREWEVLAFLRQGLSNEQIAERLGITLRTAKFHVSEILSKLAVETREQAAAWQPEEAPSQARRWLAWPLIARIASALVMVATVAGLGLLAWGVLRTSGGREETPFSDPEGLVRAALKRMESLESYSVEIVDPELGGTATVEAMNSGMIAVRTTGDISAVPGGFPANESVYTDAWQYDRFCQDYPVSCGPWTEVPAPLLINIGPIVIVPDWPIIALEEAQMDRMLPQDTSRPDLIEVSGTFEPTVVQIAALRRHLPPEKDADLVARSVRVSNELATIHVWISRDDASIDRILILLPDSTLSPPRPISFYYSHFNEVTISPPTDFLPYVTPTPTP